MANRIFGTIRIGPKSAVFVHKNIQSPFAWPARISEEILKYPERVDPDLFAQAKSYQAHIQSLISEGYTPETAAKTLQQRGYRFRGWNKSLITKLLYPAAKFNKPHRMPSVPPTLGPEFVSSWNKEVLLGKLTESVRRGPFESIPLPEFYKTIAGRAGRFGLGRELLSRLGSEVPQSLSDIISPPTWSTKVSRTLKSIRGLPTGYKIGLGAAIGLLGLYALQPGSYFSGFQEKGEAKKNRQWLTDFGSGYKGLDINQDKTISPLEKRFGKFARALKKYGVETGTGHKRIYIPKDILSEQNIQELGFTAVKIAIPETGQTRFESYRHPNVLFHLHEHGKYWTMHEDVDPSLTMSLRQWAINKTKGIQSSIGDLSSRVWAGMKHIFTEGIPGAYYYIKGKILGGEDMLTRIQQEISPRYKKLVNKWEIQQDRIFSGFGRAYNTIEGLFHGGQAEKKRRELTDFGSGAIREKLLQRGIQLFRGTKEKIATHFVVGEKSVLSAIPQQVENIFEAIRKSEFQYRPSRLESTFWAISPHEAAFYTRGGTEPTVSRITRTMEDIRRPFIGTFFTRSDIVSEAAIVSRSGGPRAEIETLARQYWKGLQPSEVEAIVANPGSPDYRYIESLIPGRVKAEKQWVVEGRKWKYVKPEVLKPYVPSAQTIGMKAERRALDIESHIQKKHLEAAGVERTKYLTEEQKQAIQEEIKREYPWESKILDFYRAGEFDRLEKEAVARFSAKDDFYNTIMGLSEKGIASKTRKINTDFGSGWRGLLSLPEILQPLIRQRGMSMTKERLATFLGEKISTVAEKKALSEFLFKAGRSPFEEVAVINPLAIRKAAQKQGIAYSKALKGTIAHERLHQRIRQFGLREEIDLAVPEGFKKIYANRGMSNEAIAEEYLANAVEMGYISPTNQSQAAKSYLKQNIIPALNMGNTLEGFGEMGMAGLNRKRYGFGPGSIWKRIISLARRFMKNPKAETSLEKLISPMSETQIENIFGKEISSFSPRQIRSGLFDKWHLENKIGLPSEFVKQTPLELAQEIKAGEFAYDYAVLSKKVMSAAEMKVASNAEWEAFRARLNPRVDVRAKAAKVQMRQQLHNQAQKDLWKNATKSGRGHISKDITGIF